MSRLLQDWELKEARSCAAFNLRRASRAVSAAYDAGLAPTGLRATQFAILTAIAGLEPAPIGDIARMLVMDQTTMTRNLRLLEREGLVDIPARGAKRQKHVTLTPQGTRKLKAAMPVWRAVQTRFDEAFGAQKWRDLRRELLRATTLTLQQD